jgi:hypothetical protein
MRTTSGISETTRHPDLREKFVTSWIMTAAGIATTSVSAGADVVLASRPLDPISDVRPHRRRLEIDTVRHRVQLDPRRTGCVHSSRIQNRGLGYEVLNSMEIQRVARENSFEDRSGHSNRHLGLDSKKGKARNGCMEFSTATKARSARLFRRLRNEGFDHSIIASVGERFPWTLKTRMGRLAKRPILRRLGLFEQVPTLRLSLEGQKPCWKHNRHQPDTQQNGKALWFMTGKGLTPMAEPCSYTADKTIARPVLGVRRIGGRRCRTAFDRR